MSYPSFWRSVLRELADLPTPKEWRAAKSLLEQPEFQLWTSEIEVEWTACAKLLGLDPAAFRKKWDKMSGADRPLLWLRLRYLAHLSTNAAMIAESVEMESAGPYRKALRSVAERLREHQLEPSPYDLLGERPFFE